MKNFKLLIILITVIATSVSCKKLTTDPNTYTLKGKVYVNCNKTPIANARVVYIDNGTTGFGSGGNLFIGDDTTKADGSFEIRYKLPEGNKVLIEPNLVVIGVNTIYGVPEAKNLENLEVFAAPTCILDVKLNVQKPYTSADTLYINNLITNTGNMKVAGPFNSGLVYSVPNYSVLRHYFIDVDHPAYDSSKYVGYRLNKGNWSGKNFAPIPCQRIEVLLDVK